MVAGSSPHPSAYAAGDRLACRPAATHRWLSPWGWRRWRRWWRPASCWPSRSTGRRPTGSTHPCPTWAAPASSRSSRRGMVGEVSRPSPAPPGRGAARRGRNRSRSPRPPPLRPGGRCRAGTARPEPAAPARATPGRPQAARGPPVPDALASPSGQAPAGGPRRRAEWRVVLPDRHRRDEDNHRRWPGRDRPHPDRDRHERDRDDHRHRWHRDGHRSGAHQR